MRSMNESKANADIQSQNRGGAARPGFVFPLFIQTCQDYVVQRAGRVVLHGASKEIRECRLGIGNATAGLVKRRLCDGYRRFRDEVLVEIRALHLVAPASCHDGAG